MIHDLPRRPFVLIRHGQTDANRDGIIAGRLDAMLTEKGRAAAMSLATMTWPGPIRVFSSPQTRARDTAALAFPGRQATLIEDLRERHWGIHEGQPVAAIPPRESTPEGGESWDDINARVARAIRQAHLLAGDALPVMVAHSGVIRVVRHLAFGQIQAPSAANTTPYLYRFENGQWHESLLDPAMNGNRP